MRVLVIEDEADTARYLRKGLQESGYSVAHCADGVEGLHLAKNEPWDLMIVDRMLAGEMDGLAIVRTLRESGLKTPVLILSALASLDERVRGLRGGADDYLTKPFAFSELLARIEALLRRTGVREDVDELQVADLKRRIRACSTSRNFRP